MAENIILGKREEMCVCVVISVVASSTTGETHKWRVEKGTLVYADIIPAVAKPRAGVANTL